MKEKPSIFIRTLQISWIVGFALVLVGAFSGLRWLGDVALPFLFVPFVAIEIGIYKKQRQYNRGKTFMKNKIGYLIGLLLCLLGIWYFSAGVLNPNTGDRGDAASLTSWILISTCGIGSVVFLTKLVLKKP